MSFLLPKILQYALSSTGIGRVAYLVITSLQPPDPQGCKLNIFWHVCIHSLSHLNLLFLDFNINNDTFFWLSYTSIHLCHQVVEDVVIEFVSLFKSLFTLSTQITTLLWGVVLNMACIFTIMLRFFGYKFFIDKFSMARN